MSRSTRDDKPAKPALKRQNAKGYLLAGIFKESKNDYDYANIVAYLRHNAGGSYAVATMGKHIQFHKRNEQAVVNTSVKSPSIQKRMAMFQAGDVEAGSIGWKLHISVNPYEVDAAWSIIHPVLLKYNVSVFKIIHPEVLKTALENDNADKVDNKQFTIYQFKNPEFTLSQWESIIKEIEMALRNEKIRPSGDMPKANMQIEGSQYFSYRNDKTINYKDLKEVGYKYISDVDAEDYAQNSSDKTLQAYNLVKEDDPFESINLFKNNSPEL